MDAPAETAAITSADQSAGEEAPRHRSAAGRAVSALGVVRTRHPAVIFVLALVCGLIASSIVIVVSTAQVRSAWGHLFTDPGAAFSVTFDFLGSAYGALLKGAIANPAAFSRAFQYPSLATWSQALTPLGNTIVSAVPLIITGLGLSLAYRSGAFNMGGQSQLILGAVAASWVGFSFTGLPWLPHVLLAFAAAAVGGALAGLIPGVLKAVTGASEVIVTIMLNYIMIYFLTYLLSFGYLMQAPHNSNQITSPIAGNAHLPLLFGSHLRINAGFLIALACAAGVWWLLNRTTTGFEFRSIGKNPSAARVAGMNVERTWVLVMLIAGGLAGLSGATVIQGTDFTLNFQSYGTYGIDAITVALLGLGRPLGVVLAGLFFGALHAGAPLMQSVTGTPVDMVQVLQGATVLFVAAPLLVRTMYNLRAAKAAGVGGVMSKGWNA